MADDLADLDNLLPGPVTVLGDLGGSPRSQVRRVRAADGTVVVKQFAAGAEGFAREVAALSVLPPEAPAPRLLDVRADPPTVVLADLGSGPSVADLLLGGDPAAARDGVLSWAESVARLHDISVSCGDAFRAALAERTDQPVSTALPDIEEALGEIETYGRELGVPIPAGAWDRLRQLGVRLESGPAVLSPGDTCPDNNVATATGRVLLDFEAAQWRHPAWDVAYLMVPWPTCWCAWQLPHEVSESALAHYRETSALGWAGSDDFRRDVGAASVVWAIMTAALFLPPALGDDPPPANPAKRMPSRRSLIVNRLAAAEASGMGALSRLAGDLRAALVARWGERPLPYAPAFERRTDGGTSPVLPTEPVIRESA